MTAQALLQARIDAQQDYDAIVYAQRALTQGTTSAGTCFLVGPYERQWRTGRRAAQLVLGELTVYHPCYGAYEAKRFLKRGRDAAAARLKDAKAELKAFGGVRQLRLALAGADETMAAAA